MALWVIPGAALPNGQGWKLWLSLEGSVPFPPGPITIKDQHGQPQQAQITWSLHDTIPGFPRRLGVATVTLPSPHPGGLYTIEVPGTQPFRLRSLPDSLEEPVSFMFSSCFWHPADREGHYAGAVKAIPSDWTPAFKFLLGDQVYCDWPADLSWDLKARRAYEVYGSRYHTYWSDEAYRAMLGTSPNFFLCDDHEYWNDYPEFQFHLMRSWRGYRDAYAQAADRYYQAFQACTNPSDTRWYTFHVGPVSFFVSDSRSGRQLQQSSASHFFVEEQWRALEAWATALRGPGLLVLGQPLLQKDGDFRDHSLSNFRRDYDRLWTVLERATHDIFLISGDIHTNRYSTARRGSRMIREFIASPAAMIRPGSTTPETPPSLIRVGEGERTRTWKVDQDPFLCLSNTVGLVRMSQGTNRRIRLELGLWQIRPHHVPDRSERRMTTAHAEGDFRFLFQDEVELR